MGRTDVETNQVAERARQTATRAVQLFKAFANPFADQLFRLDLVEVDQTPDGFRARYNTSFGPVRLKGTASGLVIYTSGAETAALMATIDWPAKRPALDVPEDEPDAFVEEIITGCVKPFRSLFTMDFQAVATTDLKRDPSETGGELPPAAGWLAAGDMSTALHGEIEMLVAYACARTNLPLRPARLVYPPITHRDDLHIEVLGDDGQWCTDDLLTKIAIDLLPPCVPYVYDNEGGLDSVRFGKCLVYLNPATVDAESLGWLRCNRAAELSVIDMSALHR